MPGDFGPIYAETDFTRFPVDLYNTVSNFAFLLLIVVFARRTRMDWRRFPLIVCGLPILSVGFVGGTVFHALHSNPLWLFMDFMPILVLTTLCAAWFWDRLLHSPVIALLLSLLPFFLTGALRTTQALPRGISIGIGYSLFAAGILVPAFIVAAREPRVGASYLLRAVLAFSVAIIWRQLDRPLVDVFPIGTHFLWHLFGALSTFFLLQHVYLLYIADESKHSPAHSCTSSQASPP